MSENRKISPQGGGAGRQGHEFRHSGLFPRLTSARMKFSIRATTPTPLEASTSADSNATSSEGALRKVMRRRLGLFIPIVVLAVLVQLIAPIAAFRVVAYATSDPLYLASICTDTAPSPGKQTAPVKTQHAHGECCAFCGAGHGGTFAVNSPPLIFVALQRQYQWVSWLEAAEPMVTVRVGSNAQARAPPFSS
jgi:hypothetical protein